VNRLDLAGLSCQPERSGRDTEKLRGLTKVQPRFDSVIGGFVDGNAVMRAQRGDALAGPAIAMACHQTVPVQDAGDEIVIGTSADVIAAVRQLVLIAKVDPIADPASLATLAADLKTVWTAPSTDARLKKRIVRTVIHEVIADIDPEAAEIVLVVHWIGGVHSEIRLPRRRRGQRNSSKMAVRPMASPIDGLTKSLNQADIKRQAKRFLRWRQVNKDKLVAHHDAAL